MEERTNSFSSNELSFFYKLIDSHPRISPEKVRQLAALAKRGDRGARDELIEANLRLIAQHARGWRGKGIVSMADLVQEAIINLLGKLSDFDPRKGKFATWAVPIIDKAMARAIDVYGTTMRIPIREAEKLRRSPFFDNRWDTVPLDTEISGENGSFLTLADCIRDDSAPCSQREIEQSELARKLSQAIAALPPRWRQVIRLHYYEDLDCAEIGRRIGCSRHWARQIRNKALEQLRTDQGLKALV